MNKHDDLVERLYDTQVCSPAQNYCRNNSLFDEAATTIQSLTERVAELEAKGECLALTIEGLSKLVGKADYQPEALVNWRATLSNGETK